MTSFRASMEDLATGRMSVAQIAQRIRRRARTTDGPQQVHDFALVKRLLQEEVEDILARLRATVRDDRSLGSYARADLHAVAAAEDAF